MIQTIEEALSHWYYVTPLVLILLGGCVLLINRIVHGTHKPNYTEELTKLRKEHETNAVNLNDYMILKQQEIGLNEELQSLISQLEEYKKQCTDLNNKNILLSEQLSKLNTLTEEEKNEQDSWVTKYTQLGEDVEKLEQYNKELLSLIENIKSEYSKNLIKLEEANKILLDEKETLKIELDKEYSRQYIRESKVNYQEIIRQLREDKSINIYVWYNDTINCTIEKLDGEILSIIRNCKSYEEALNKGIEYVNNNLKD